MDEIVYGHAFDGKVRFSVARTTRTVNEARVRHDLSPLSAVVLGRLMTGAILTTPWLAEREVITFILDGDGPVGRVVAQARGDFTARGYVSNTKVETMINDLGKFDVSRAVGSGKLTVVRDLKLKYPIVSQVPIVSGEIAQDIAYYFTKSEQLPTTMALGVLVDKDGIVSAGGFAIQLIDRSVPENLIEELEMRAKFLGGEISRNLTEMEPEDIARRLFKEHIGSVQRKTVQFSCDCNREKAFQSILVLPSEEIEEMIEEGRAEVRCKWCGKVYEFDENDLKRAFSIKLEMLEGEE